MPRCGDCEYYRASPTSGLASGLCSAQKTGEKTYKLVMYHDDASKCSYYKHLDESEVRTDSRESSWSPQRWRVFKDYEEKKVDVNVDKEKLEDTKDWG
jgi:hypothetical protein